MVALRKLSFPHRLLFPPNFTLRSKIPLHAQGGGHEPPLPSSLYGYLTFLPFDWVGQNLSPKVLLFPRPQNVVHALISYPWSSSVRDSVSVLLKNATSGLQNNPLRQAISLDGEVVLTIQLGFSRYPFRIMLN